MSALRVTRLILLGFTLPLLIGHSPAQTASVSPLSLSFGKKPIGVTSLQKTVTLTNTGGADLIIASVAATGDFGVSSLCPGSLARTQSCKIGVTFTPTATGSRTGTLTITDNAPGGSQSVALSGIGTNGIVIAPSKLAFTSSVVGVAAPSMSIKVTNNLPSSVSV